MDQSGAKVGTGVGLAVGANVGANVGDAVGVGVGFAVGNEHTLDVQTNSSSNGQPVPHATPSSNSVVLHTE